MAAGLLAMIALFNGMQSSLAMVYDREMGVMLLLLTAPLPRGWLLACKLLGGMLLSLLQKLAFLLVASGFGVTFAWQDLPGALAVMALAALMLGALGLLLSVHVRQLENFAGTMNFVIFPMFFISSPRCGSWRNRAPPSSTNWRAPTRSRTRSKPSASRCTARRSGAAWRWWQAVGGCSSHSHCGATTRNAAWPGQRATCAPAVETAPPPLIQRRKPFFYPADKGGNIRSRD